MPQLKEKIGTFYFIILIRWVDQGLTEEDDHNYAGLLPGHAYSIIQVKEVVSQVGDYFKILNIRNPYNVFEWKGDWSDNSEKWTDEIRQKIQPSSTFFYIIF